MTAVKTENGFVIIPIHLNIIFMNEKFSYGSTNLDEKKMECILSELSEQETILDFRYIKNKLSPDTIELLVKGIEHKKVLIINIQSHKHTFENMIGDDAGNFLEYKDENLFFCLITKDFPVEKIPGNIAQFGYLKDFLESQCRDVFLKKEIGEEERKKRISSNVYTNKHFDIRYIFTRIETVRIAVYLLANELDKRVRSGELGTYKLISSSLNGCILANLLAIMFEIRHVSIPHLGPEITVEDNRYLDYIEPNDRLVYIYDFIALGNEQKTISILADLLNAKIIFSLGLSHYRPAEREKDNTHSIIAPDKILGDMHIVGSEDDLRILTGGENV